MQTYYCLSLWKNKPFTYETTLISTSLEGLIREIDRYGEASCVIKCCRDIIDKTLSSDNFDISSLNSPISDGDKWHGLAFWKKTSNSAIDEEALHKRACKRFSNDPNYNYDYVYPSDSDSFD